MKLHAIVRIVTDTFHGRSLREHYWEFSRLLSQVGYCLVPSHHVFAKVVAGNQARFTFSSAVAIKVETPVRAKAAAQWLLRAQDASPDGGVSYGYFPVENVNGWDVSYPETTGYIMTTLLEYHRRTSDPLLLKCVERMAQWEIDIQMPNGAVQGGKLCPPEQQTAATFNTGMVLDGWMSVYQVTGDEDVLAAARRAGDFLLNDMTAEGYFQTNGAYVSNNKIKVYNCLCAWALYRLGITTVEDQYLDGAIRAVEAALRKQQPNGWFADNCLSRHEAPLLHTIGYTLQGVLEVGVLAGRDDFIDAVIRGVEPILERMEKSAFLHGRFYSDWEPAAFSSCLTGSAQFAIVLYRLAQCRDEPRYRRLADSIVDYLKALQILDSKDPGINGALAGSFPIFGDYMTGGYPNWATKYFLDALLLQMDAAGDGSIMALEQGQSLHS